MDGIAVIIDYADASGYATQGPFIQQISVIAKHRFRNKVTTGKKQPTSPPVMGRSVQSPIDVNLRAK
jgi:hypothetical protein